MNFNLDNTSVGTFEYPFKDISNKPLPSVNAAITALSDMKNPDATPGYKNNAPRNSKDATSNYDLGFVNIDVSSNTISVVTCYQLDCKSGTDNKLISNINLE